jgi:hypothetical protein
VFTLVVQCERRRPEAGYQHEGAWVRNDLVLHEALDFQLFIPRHTEKLHTTAARVNPPHLGLGDFNGPFIAHDEMESEIVPDMKRIGTFNGTPIKGNVGNGALPHPVIAGKDDRALIGQTQTVPVVHNPLHAILAGYSKGREPAPTDTIPRKQEPSFFGRRHPQYRKLG